MILGLLIDRYATATFSSRKIEKLTSENLAVRFLTGDTHPDHDFICTFRRENKEPVENSFHRIHHGAARSQILKVGDIRSRMDPGETRLSHQATLSHQQFQANNGGEAPSRLDRAE